MLLLDRADEGQAVPQRDDHLLDAGVGGDGPLNAWIATPFAVGSPAVQGCPCIRVLSTQTRPCGASSPQLEHGVQVLEVPRLVGVDEDQVEALPAREPAQGVLRGADPDVDLRVRPGTPRNNPARTRATSASISHATTRPSAGSASAIASAE